MGDGGGEQGKTILFPQKRYMHKELKIMSFTFCVHHTGVEFIKQFQAQSSLSSPSCTYPYSCVIKNGFLPKCIQNPEHALHH